jgi:hypothetical protein
MDGILSRKGGSGADSICFDDFSGRAQAAFQRPKNCSGLRVCHDGFTGEKQLLGDGHRQLAR